MDGLRENIIEAMRKIGFMVSGNSIFKAKTGDIIVTIPANLSNNQIDIVFVPITREHKKRPKRYVMKKNINQIAYVTSRPNIKGCNYIVFNKYSAANITTVMKPDFIGNILPKEAFEYIYEESEE